VTAGGSPVDRRRALRLLGAGLLGGLAATGCRSDAGSSAGSGSGTAAPARPTPTPTPTPSRPPTLPPVPAWQPLPAEPLPGLKRAAADFVQGLATRSGGARPEDAMASVAGLSAPGFDTGAALAVAAPLFDAPVSSGEIVYPQFGGLVPNGPRASEGAVMVVLRQRRLSATGTVGEVVRTVDVRLRVVEGAWRVVELASVGGEPVDRPDVLDPTALAVLDDPRIELPDSARWDVHAGRIAPEVLAVLADAAGRAPLSVAVLRAGHPDNVFGSSRLSDHTRGRAVDVWAVGGVPVVAQPTVGSPYRAVLEGAFADPRVRQTGSPDGSDLDGGGRRSFTDTVHADHLHLATTGTPPSP
jgi:hypothetical protein